MGKKLKWLFALIFIVIIVGAGFTFTVKEGSCAIISRFGKIVNVHMRAGLHLKLPWPADKIITYDTRSRNMDSAINETITNDKINIILQTYLVWHIKDPKKFYMSVGDYEIAQKHLEDLVTNVKNSVIGNYAFSSLVSTDLDNIKMEEICKAIEEKVALSAMNNYGIGVGKLKFKRLALPDTNIQSVFRHMIAERQTYIARYFAEGERDAAIIAGEAYARAAEIVAQGRFDAAEIDAETERLITGMYREANDKNTDLFVFLKKLITLENSVNPNTVVIMRAGESPANVISVINERDSR